MSATSRTNPVDTAVAANVESVVLEAVVIRANGEREDLGVVAAYHRNPFRALLARLRGAAQVRLSS